ncbi:LysE family translocator [Ralstonia solanacearum]|uniref:LysE family translocator n=1 Tax=Ralstonia solanacearum TaxID=305 RepID=UPI000181731A|nr:LysE family translocator [Ralstonia solanacearum]KFX26620.1 lysine transporter LysE [Ralstonia solanacearum]MDC6178085.1 LysE family translocator [Ralstonia solanacearum]MDC6210450.1 LysE family translocator [Ralstonia solanacearum]MDC6238985.1 LysE family translocator [Ralstonia solanacearum]MDD7800758.1 LysE family translocator [Ralstonia solanacearum]
MTALATNMLTAFWVLSISLVLVPGADWAYAISAGMRDRAIAPAIGGMLLGYLTITAVVAAGVGALVASAPAILTVLTVLGAGYLLWLGGNVLVHPSVPTAGDDHASSAMGWLVRGFAVSGVNPKALLLFLALLPQFTSRSGAWSISTQIGALGLVQIVNCALVYSLVGLGAKIVLRTRPKVARTISQLSGVAMIAIGLFLLAEQFPGFTR